MAFDIHSMDPGNGRKFRESNSYTNTADLSEEYLGGKGFVVITDTGTHTPATGMCFKALHVLTNAVFASYTVDASAPITGSFATVTINAGTVLYGKFTSVTLTSGSILAYNGVLL